MALPTARKMSRLQKFWISDPTRLRFLTKRSFQSNQQQPTLAKSSLPKPFLLFCSLPGTIKSRDILMVWFQLRIETVFITALTSPFPQCAVVTSTPYPRSSSHCRKRRQTWLLLCRYSFAMCQPPRASAVPEDFCGSPLILISEVAELFCLLDRLPLIVYVWLHALLRALEVLLHVQPQLAIYERELPGPCPAAPSAFRETPSVHRVLKVPNFLVTPCGVHIVAFEP